MGIITSFDRKPFIGIGSNTNPPPPQKIPDIPLPQPHPPENKTPPLQKKVGGENNEQ
ncbi:MAG: hypothetical protein Ta2G_17430 [Termitinemataceae bacterium]|nr:MAG: hypothetical protein Ta2G_17430 [Termitinemataceae bacterium]